MRRLATNEIYEENRKEKHRKNAKCGWYSYDSRFALPVFGENGEIERYNENKKRNEHPFPAKRPYSVTKPIS